MLRQMVCWIIVLGSTVLGYSQTQLAGSQSPTVKVPIWSLERMDNYVSLVTGIGQLTQGGFNIEGNLFYKRLVVDYSHGVNLQWGNAGLEAGADQEQGLSFVLPWTTGFGFGFRFTDWLNLRAEPKWHRFDVYQAVPDGATAYIDGYTTFTLGLGLYANIRPFKKMKNFLKGITIVPNVRWWPRVSSSLDQDQLIYTDADGQQQTHQARQIGIGNTPFFFNISVGYSLVF